VAFLKFLGRHKEGAEKFKEELEAPPAPPEYRVRTLQKEQPTVEVKTEEPKVEEVVSTERETKVTPLERRAVSKTKEQLAVREGLVLTKPIFVMAENFMEMVREISSANSVLRKSNDELKRLDELKTDKDKEFEKWKRSLEDIQRKLIFVDKTLFEAK